MQRTPEQRAKITAAAAAASGYFFPWQRELIAEIVFGQAKYVTLEKSRRVGGTWALAVAAVQYCLRTGHNCWFSSSDERNGREFIIYVTEFCRVFNAVAGSEVIDHGTHTAEIAYLPNGSRIVALSGSPRALRGKDGLIILDEMALRDDQDALWRAAQPCVIQRGKLVILSTHNGPTTVFYRLVEGAKAGKRGWRAFRVTLEQAVAEGYAWRFNRTPGDDRARETVDRDFVHEVKGSCLSIDHYKQEYGCEPLSLKTLISPEAYDRVALWDVPDHLEPDIVAADGTVSRRYRDLYAGIDVGRTHDLTVLWIVEQWKNPHARNLWDEYDYRTVAVKAIRNEPFPVQYQKLKPMVAHPQMRKVLVDQGSVGRALADAFCDEFSDRCDPFNFHPTHKAEVAERLAGYIDSQRLSVPKASDDGHPHPAREDFIAVRREPTPNGNGLRYEGETATTHCDHFWAAGMAVSAADLDMGIVVVQ